MRRRYSDEERADALVTLDACGGNLSRAAKLAGVPLKTIADWRDGAVADGVAELRNVKKEALADRLEALAHQIIDAMPGMIAGTSLKDAAVSVGVAVDKAQLLKGQPTAITQTQLSDADRATRITEILGRAEGRAGLQAPDPGGAAGSRCAAGGERAGVVH